MTLRNLKLTVLGCSLLLVIFVSLLRAEDKAKTFSPSKEQALELRVSQLELQNLYRALIDQNTAFTSRLKQIQDQCDQIIKANNWPKEVSCSAKTASDINQLFAQPISFAEPEKPKAEPAKK